MWFLDITSKIKSIINILNVQEHDSLELLCKDVQFRNVGVLGCEKCSGSAPFPDDNKLS